MTKKGKLIVIAAPSGTGKTTLVKKLLETVPNLAVSISHTTRGKRPNETDGVDYYFVDKQTFKEMIAQNDFLEYATVFENFYGTSKSMVEKTLSTGTDVILEIDWQGHQQVKRLFPEEMSIFITPPSKEALKERLNERGEDSAEVIAKRLADADETLSHADEFDHIVVNDELDRALKELQAIIKTDN